MSIGRKGSIARYVGDGITRIFSFDFKVWEESEIRVVGEGASGETELSVKVQLLENGGKVEFSKAPLKGVKFAILRNMPFEQTQSYMAGTRFDPAVLEEQFDRDCAERQQLLEALSRAVKAPASSGLAPHDYEREFWEKLAAGKNEALSGINRASQALEEKLAAGQTAMAGLAESAGKSEREAASSLEEIKRALANDFANGLKQALNAAAVSKEAAAVSKEAAANIEETVLEAAEKAAECISTRLSSAARLAELHSAAAAQSACQAAINGEKSWLMVRGLTEEAGRQAAACILEEGRLYAAMANASSRASAASAANAGNTALIMQAVIHEEALMAAKQAAGEVADCLENVCVGASEMSLRNSRAASEAARLCNEIALSMRVEIQAAAQKAAKEAAERVLTCAEEFCSGCVEICLAHARAAADSARLALEYARDAMQTDICEEAKIRRQKDADLEERLTILELKINGEKNGLS